MSCIINFIHPVVAEFPTEVFKGEMLLVEKEQWDDRGWLSTRHHTTIYFRPEHLPALRDLVTELEKIDAEKAAVAVEKTDHAECTEAVGGEMRWDRDAT